MSEQAGQTGQAGQPGQPGPWPPPPQPPPWAPPPAPWAPPTPPVAAGPRRQHPLLVLTGARGAGRALLQTVIATVVVGRAVDGSAIVPLVAVPLLVLALVVRWLTTTYEVADGALRLSSGVTTRNRREVPFDRIQQVDVRRTLLLRLFGACELGLDTAGGKGAEVKLVLADDEAERLQLLVAAAAPVRPPATTLTPGPDGVTPDGAPPVGAAAWAPPAPTTELVRIGVGDLLLASLTTTRQLAVLAVGLGALAQLPLDLERVVADAGERGGALGALGFVALGVGALLLWFGLAAVAQLRSDLGFVLVTDGTALRVRRGFPTQTAATVPRERVQLVVVNQSPVRRLLGVASVDVVAAGSSSSEGAAVSRLSIPILRLARVPEVIAAALPPGATAAADLAAVLRGDAGALPRNPGAALRRRILRRLASALVVAAAVAVGVALDAVPPLALVPVVALAVAVVALAGHAHRTTGQRVDGDLLCARAGGVVWATTLVPLGRVQHARSSATTFQRRSGLASARLGVAGHTTGMADIGADVAAHLLATAPASSAARADERAVRARTRPSLA